MLIKLDEGKEKHYYSFDEKFRKDYKPQPKTTMNYYKILNNKTGFKDIIYVGVK